ncbi:tRNA pseudouridine synthase 1 [Teratosphaeriaceae sp. CCFEE 6253]|nr:tRNA pseudouridine synthase 1 [Teratosphaeriaceae sp. CCFEE 6253]
MGTRGYHFHDKSTGELLGILKPAPDLARHHIKHPPYTNRHNPAARTHGPSAQLSPQAMPREDRFAPITVSPGPLPRRQSMLRAEAEDEWGAGALCGDMMVGISRAGRVFVCGDWRQALQGNYRDAALIECETTLSDFDLGGWLAVKDHRIMFEVQKRIYIVALDDDDRLPARNIDVFHPTASPARPSYSLLAGSAPQLATPVSFMALYDDCIMSTFTMSRQTLALEESPHGDEEARHGHRSSLFATKMIRVVSLAPEPDTVPTPLGQSTEG